MIKSKRNRQVSRWRGKKQSNLSKVLASSNNITAVREAYFHMAPGEIRANVSNVATHLFFSSLIKLTLHGDLSNTYRHQVPHTNLLVSINWALGLLVHHKELINRFIKYESRLTNLILDEEYDEAISVLNEVDALCGLSTWSVTLRDSTLKLAHKEKESNNAFENLQSRIKDNQFFSTTCRYSINRYDTNSSVGVSTYTALKNQIVRRIPLPLKDFLIYKFIPSDFSPNYRINYEHIFNFENESSIIDVFKMVISFLSNALNSNDLNEEDLARMVIDKLAPHISYYILDGLAACYGISTKWQHDRADYELIDLYSKGAYVELCEKVRSRPTDLLSFTIFEIVARSAGRTEGCPYEGLKKNILLYLVSVISKQDNYHQSLAHLRILCHAFSGLPWFQELHFLVSRESSFIDEKTQRYLTRLSAAYSRVNSPRKAVMLPEALQDDYLKACKDSIGNSLSIKLFEIIKDGRLELFTDTTLLQLEATRLLKYKSKLLIKAGLIHDAIPILERLILCKDSITRYEAIKLLIDAYIDVQEIERAATLFAEAALENNNIVLGINTHKISNVITTLVSRSSSICLSIALSFHSRLVGSNYDSALRYAFECFLMNIDVKNPLEISTKSAAIGEPKINYFLEYVCTQDVMKLSFLFKDKLEIENARIAICTHLINVTGTKESLVNELKEITKEQTLRKAVQQVNHSRIYADLSGFKNDRSQVYRDIFDSYLQLKKNDFSAYEDEAFLTKMYESLNKEMLSKAAHNIYVLDVSLNPKNKLFHKLVSMLRDEFTFGNKGLNSYLSTRIRHGVLPGALRLIVNKERIVTVINPETKTPRSNTYWKEKLSLLSEDEWAHIEKALRKFTLDYESIITEINDEWLQIFSLDQDIARMQKGGERQKALFNYSISNLETYLLQRSLSDDDYESFIRNVSQWLWARTEINLQRVKSQIAKVARERFIECYDSLSQSVNLAAEHAKVASLHDAISKSKDSIYGALNSVSTWFTRSESDNVKEFELFTAIDIAARVADVSVDATAVQQGIIFEGKYLNSLVDILHILFENAVTKSCVTKDNLVIKVMLKVVQNDSLLLEVVNRHEIQETVPILNERLRKYLEVYGNEEHINSLVQKEGGTGIFKIWRILSKDVEISHKLDCAYNADNTFTISISMWKAKGVLYRENTIS